MNYLFPARKTQSGGVYYKQQELTTLNEEKNSAIPN